MKSRTIKTRLAAFGLALLMGLSPFGNLADVHAAETKNPSEPVTESAEISETEQTECRATFYKCLRLKEKSR